MTDSLERNLLKLARCLEQAGFSDLARLAREALEQHRKEKANS